MLKPFTIALALSSLATSAGAATKTPEAKLHSLLAGRSEGRPTDCISLSRIRSSEVIAGRALVYRTTGNELFVNYGRAGAASIDDDDVLVTKTPSDRLCSVDTVRLYQRGTRVPSGAVILGDFVPYSRPAKLVR